MLGLVATTIALALGAMSVPEAASAKRLSVKVVGRGGTAPVGGQASAWFKVAKGARCSLSGRLGSVRVRTGSVRAHKQLFQYAWMLPADARPGRWLLRISCRGRSRSGTAKTALVVTGGPARGGRPIFTRKLRPYQAGLTTGGGAGAPTGPWPAFGDVLVAGKDWLGGGGVDVMSNGKIGCQNGCNSLTPYGIAYQCVELINRFLVTKGWSSRIWGNAHEIYENAPADKFDKHPNGSGYTPIPGDILVWDAGDGHVAIVESVVDGHVNWVEQNNSSTGRNSAPLGPNGTLPKLNRLVPDGVLHAKANVPPKPESQPLQGSSPDLQGSAPPIQGSSPPLQGGGDGAGGGPPPAPTPPPPSPSVSVSKGGSAQGQPNCSSTACAYVNVSFKDFPDGQHTVTCHATGEEGGFYTYTRLGTSDSSAVCYYGYPGSEVWATVDGVASNHVGW